MQGVLKLGNFVLLERGMLIDALEPNLPDLLRHVPVVGDPVDDLLQIVSKVDLYPFGLDLGDSLLLACDVLRELHHQLQSLLLHLLVLGPAGHAPPVVDEGVVQTLGGVL
jgi:hypothetical protein